jgi:hypothetical protein
MLYNSVANKPIKSRYAARKLYRNACNKLSGMPNISIVSREEEASSEMFLLKVFTGDCAGDRGLSCSS